jgi:hypothetical protein
MRSSLEMENALTLICRIASPDDHFMKLDATDKRTSPKAVPLTG